MVRPSRPELFQRRSAEKSLPGLKQVKPGGTALARLGSPHQPYWGSGELTIGMIGMIEDEEEEEKETKVAQGLAEDEEKETKVAQGFPEEEDEGEEEKETKVAQGFAEVAKLSPCRRTIR